MKGFEDVQPLPIVTELPDELCQIMYTEEYKQTMGIARALLQKQEYSKRALDLTAKVIGLAPAFYTIWNYRFDIVMHMAEQEEDAARLLNEELDWVDETTLNNPKNYQIWSYKQALLERHPAPNFKRELPVLELMINDDTKNYHVWSFRKWCVLFFQDFSQELSYSDLLIQKDVYNNSAWTHRMFVLKHSNPDREQIDLELDYVKEKIELVPQNVSAWAYLQGLYENFLSGSYDAGILQFAQMLTNNVTDSAESPETTLPEIESSYALEFLATVYAKTDATKKKAVKAYQALAAKYDPIREAYWQRQISMLE
ncbi:hypothetical protein HG536_0G00230 [Torulaspora globosa]|uniref:Protein farnesyltransferase/geranylgeranyltransferase type-1 subunit alpha n=1 Tax=Torulaspora globosa TaxID=48254 RepID=A0A7G3ZKY0_9SACH|nr:uncharacterized protein HG536_0G00230 [Torulaspora globosa]QLL34166.1 hypothetical protein HG536_0G00230 [Torulaspora globosa]